jgi:16S rRNA (cytosine1402-N4)-methyltransferase
MKPKHIPVMEKEILEFLLTGNSGTYMDCTLGLGGIASKILEATSPYGRLVGIDIDPQALALAKENLISYGDRVSLIHGNFAFLDQILSQCGVSQVDGILMDLGVSSYQLDVPTRGFSFRHPGPLDMRLDQTVGYPVSHDLNEKSAAELANIFRDYGEERWASRIATKIVEARKKSPITTTTQLAEIVKSAIPKSSENIHPATRTFQSLRIYKNEELKNLQTGLEKAIQVLRSGARICVVSFHSLEDRIVKRMFRTMQKGCVCPPVLPVCICGKKPLLKILTKRPLTPGEEEIRANPRSRSAKLRVAERL